MAATKWFDRKFDFSFGMEQYPLLYERLRGAPGLYRKTVAHLPEGTIQFKPGNTWSVKENIGHLSVLEPLWRKRLGEIKDKSPQMSPADLNNTVTHQAEFNKVPVDDLLENFMNERDQTIAFLDTLKQDDFSHSIAHPRLQKPMRIIDLMFFVAEHDMHHLSTIQSIISAE